MALLLVAGFIVAGAAVGTSAYVAYWLGLRASDRHKEGAQIPPEIEQAKALVASVLFDPDAAKFRSLERHAAAFADQPPVSICGEVNGKNRFGAYVGFRRFVVDLKARAVKIDPGNPETFDDADAKMEECKGYAADRLKAAWQSCTDDWRRIKEAADENQLFHAVWTVNCEYPASKGH